MPNVSGSVLFNVTNSAPTTGTGVANIPIVLQDTTSGVGLTVLSDATGAYQFTNVPAGSYRLVEAWGQAGGVASPADFTTAAVMAAPTPTDPPVSAEPSPPVGTNRIQSLSPNTLFGTVAATDVTTQNFVDGPTKNVPITINNATIVGTNLVTAADNGTWGTEPVGTPVNTYPPTEPYPGVVSGFTYVTGIPTDGSYTVTNIDGLFRTDWWMSADHTVGDETGRFQLVNGATPGALIFTQVVTVTPNTYYMATAWIMNSINKPGYEPPQLGLRVLDSSGIPIYNAVSRDIPADSIPTWYQLGNIINSVSNGTVTFQIYSNGDAAVGNDFRIDDIMIQAVTVDQIVQAVKTVDKAYAQVGDTLTYTVVLQNTGLETAGGIVFVDTIPTGTSFVPNSLTANGTVLTGLNPNPPGASISDLPAGGVTTLTFQVTVTTIPLINPIPNDASASYGFKPVVGGGTVPQGVNTNAVNTRISQANLGMTKAVDHTTSTVGDTLTYTLVFTNTGSTTADNVILTDTVPLDTTLVPNSVTVNGTAVPGDPSAGVNIGNVGAGQVSTVTFQVVVTTLPATNPIPNTAVMGYNYTVDPSFPDAQSNTGTSNPVATLIVTANINNADGGLVKAVDKPYAGIGDTVTYTIVLKNTGNTTANNVVLTDTIPTDTTFIAGSATVNGVASGSNPGVGGVPVGSLGAGQTATVTFKVTVTSAPNPNPILNDGTVNFDFVVDPSVPTSQAGLGNTNTVATTVNYASITNNDIVKSVDKTSAAIGETLTYTIGITNTGNTTANNVTFTDTIPSATSFVPGSVTVNGTPNAGNPTAGINIGSIPAGGTSTVSFNVVVGALPIPNPMPNQGLANYNYIIDPSLGTTGAGAAASNIVNTLVAIASLTATKTVAQANVGIGDTVVYTVVLQNTGNTTADNVLMTDTIPNGTTFIPGSATVNGTPSGDAPIPGINAGSIGAGQVSTVTFSVTLDTIPVPNPMLNTAGSSFTYTADPSVPDGQSGNVISNTVPTKANYVIIDNSTGNLNKAVDKPYADVGDTLTYTIAIKNTGNTTANSIVLVDTIPTDTTFVPGSVTVNGVANGNNPQFGGVTVGDVGPGQTATVTFKVVVNTLPNPNPIFNDGTINFSYITDPSVPRSAIGLGNTNTVATTVNRAIINASNIIKEVDKTGAGVGDTLTYTIGVTNTGNTTATNVTFKDTIPNGTTFVPSSVTVNGTSTAGTPATGVNLGNIPAGGTSTVSFKVIITTIPTPNPIPNQGLINYTYTINPSTGTTGTGNGASNIVDTYVASVGLTTTKTVDKANAGVGDVIVYTITMKNIGNTTADSVIMSDTIPNGTTFVFGSATVNGVANNDTPQPGINVGPIGAGQVSTVTISVTLDTIPTPNPMINTADSSFVYTADPSVPDGQSGRSTSNPVATKANYASMDQASGGLNKAVDKPYADVGDTLTYTIVVKNTGNTTATNVILTDTIPADTLFLLGTVTINGLANGDNPQVGGINIGNVGANQTVTVTFKVIVTTLPNPNPIPNDGTINFSYVTDPSVPTSVVGIGNTNTVITTINHAIINSADIVKSVDKAGAAVGDTLTYTIGLTNSGNTTATNVIFKDTIPNGTTFVTGSVTVNGVVAAGSPATGVSVGIIPVNGTSTVSFKVVVNTVPTPNPIPNQGTVNYTYVVNPSTGAIGSSSGSSNVVDTLIAQVGLTSTKTVNKANSGIGDTLVYTIALKNTGNSTALNVILTDTVPSNVTFIPGSATVNGVASSGTPQPGINVGNIDPGQVSTVTFSVTVDSIPTPNPSVNTAFTSFAYTADPLIPGGQSGTSTSNPAVNKVNQAIINNATGGLTKAVDKPYADVGDTVTYTITLKNTGNTTANTIVLTDTIPVATTFIPGSVTVNGVANAGNPEIGGINVGSLGPNQTSVVVFKVVVNTVPNPNPILNDGAISFNYVTDPSIPTTQNSTGNTNTVATTINHAIINSNSMVKSVNPTKAAVGDTLTYTVDVTNSGNTAATNVIFKDTIPNGTTFIPGSVTVNGIATAGSPATGVNMGTIAAGGTSIVSFQVVVNTMPTPNPIPNQGVVNYTYTVNPTTGTTGNGNGVSNVVNTPIVVAILQSSKAVNKANAGIGDTVTYTVALKNTGNATAGNIIMFDTVPTGMVFVPGSATVNGVASGDAPDPGIKVNNIGPNQVATVTFDVIINTLPNPNPSINTAFTSFAYTGDPNFPGSHTGNTTSNSVATKTNYAAINTTTGGLTKTVDKAYADIGDTLTYTITLLNKGNTTATNVIFTDTIPTDTTFIPGSVTVNGVASANNPQTDGITLATLAPNQTAMITFKVVVNTMPTPNPIPNGGTVNYTYITDPSGPTSKAGKGNTNVVTTQVNHAIINNNSITKTVDKHTTLIGDTLTYTVGITNVGNTSATNVMFTDTIPTGTTLIPGSVTVNGLGIAGNPGAGINIGSILASGTATVVFKVVVNTVPTPNPIPNQARIDYTYIIDPSIPTSSGGSGISNTVKTLVVNAVVSLNKRVDHAYATVGETLTYTFAIGNTGNVSATNMIITDTIPAGTAFVPGTVTVNGIASSDNPQTGINAGVVAPATTTTVTFEVVVVTLPIPNPIVNDATLNYTYTLDPSTPNGQKGSINSNPAKTQVNIAYVATTKSANKTVSKPGDTITYTLTTVNKGNVPANNIIIYDTIPQGTTFVPGTVTVNGVASSDHPATGIHVGTIAASSMAVVTFDVVVGNTLPAINPIINIASTNYTYTIDPSVPNGGKGSGRSNPLPIQINSANLGAITKVVDKPYAKCKDILTYSINVPNTGNIPAIGVIITDTPPSGTVYIGGSVTVNGISQPGANPSTGVSIGDIPAGGAVLVTYQVRVVC